MQQELSHTIHQKLQKLVKEHEQLKKENHRLQQQLEDQYTTANQQVLRLSEMENQVAVLKTNTGTMDENTKKDMERRLTQYIKDIDNAIMLLNE